MHEFDLIKKYFRQQSNQREDVVLGSGDDAALLCCPPGKLLATSVDVLVDGVHFRADWDASAVGRYVLAVNLSDLAAMGATPSWCTMGLSLPKVDQAWLADFSSGFLQLADQHSVQLVGGDLVCGPLMVTVCVYGFVDQQHSLTRGAAQTGDIIAVTGPLGAAGLGVLRLEAGEDDAERLILGVEPQLAAGQVIAQTAKIAIDLSDGLLADLGHICESSRCGAELRLTDIPLCPELIDFPDQKLALQLALTSGGDYQLCFTVAEQYWPALSSALTAIGCQASAIGHIESQPGIRCIDSAGKQLSFANGGYQHF